MIKRLEFLILFSILFLIFPLPVFSQVVLRMVGPEDLGGAWAEIARRFHGRNPDIEIQYIPGPWSTDQRQDMYIRSFMSGDAFDLVFMDVIWTAKFAEKGWLLPLEDWFPPEKQEIFLQGDIEAGRYHGRFYRAPVRSDAGLLYYRKDLIPHPPKTWQEFEEICRKYSSPPEQYGIVFQGMQYEGLVCNYLEYLWGAGGSVLDDQGKVHLETHENIMALKFMKKILDEDWAPKSVITFQEQHSLEFFEKGKALMMRNWPYVWKVLNDSPLRGKIGIAPFIHRQGKEPASTLGGWGMGIARAGKHPEAAGKFVEFVTSPEAQKILYFKTGAVPSRKSLFRDEEILKESPYYRELYEILSRARPRPVHPDYARISAILQKHVSSILVERESPREASHGMQRSLESLLKGRKENWLKRLALDDDLFQTARNTAFFTLISVPSEFFLGLLMALFIHLPFRGRNLGRLAVLIPWALPTAVMAMSWQWMFNNPFGIINDVLVRAGLLSIPADWLSTAGGAMFAALFADIWKTTPFVVIILLAGLQSVPKELQESLSLDGAGPLKRFFQLTLPMLIPYIRVALIFRMIHAAGIFDLIWVLTKGGPADSTRTLSLYIYDLAFQNDEIGYALFLTSLFIAALILMSFAVTRGLTLRYERVGR
ncbi:MAG TPA: extracellular solute-binding protein [Thermodesulfobacteriota bacterium]|nr:extracellular solute-binding protein [Thermodesulfobacteriota bacterium]